MKYVIVRCEDDARGSEQTATLLDGAKIAHLQQLAQAGAAGSIRHRRDQNGLDRFQLHRALFGLEPNDPEASAGRCCAASVNLQLDSGETAWCCEFVTHQGGRIIDLTAGRITTKESEILIQALDDQLGSDTRQWVVGEGSHHVLVARDAPLGPQGPPLPSPDLLLGEFWNRSLPKGALGEALQSVIEQASELLETHPVNRVRVDLGENPANMLWLWGASEAGPHTLFAERRRLSGAVLSNGFLLRGFARSLGLDWHEGPASLEESALRRLTKTAVQVIERRDFVYLHLSVDTADPVERLCAMERLDQILLSALTEALPALGSWRLLIAVDDQRNKSVPVVAIGTGLPRQPIAHLNAQSFAESPLAFENGSGLFSWFTKGE